ncbi:hypothetical protein O181_001063 [Austropuccinia psidii MF-1]|uniref:separase n=1 Tax=Austropuccinia psidii MF-1 TaxID=1389203 RepID=A0A9Q3GBD9_9BASI|nr:hypothetical protein [Austropuccinia psidii MF-1]
MRRAAHVCASAGENSAPHPARGFLPSRCHHPRRRDDNTFVVELVKISKSSSSSATSLPAFQFQSCRLLTCLQSEMPTSSTAAPSRRSTRARPGTGKTAASSPSKTTQDLTDLPPLPTQQIKNRGLSATRTRKALAQKASQKSSTHLNLNDINGKPHVNLSDTNGKRSASKPMGREPSSSVDVLANGVQKIAIDSKPTHLRCKHSMLSPPSESKVDLPIGEKITLQMKAVNLNLSKLSAVRKSGWKADVQPIDQQLLDSKEDGSNSWSNKLNEVLVAINQCYLALHALRKLTSTSSNPSHAYGIERAGLALVNHVLELKLYNPALRLLEIAHDSLQALIYPSAPAPLPLTLSKSIDTSPIASTAWDSFSKVLTFSIPKNLEQVILPSLKDVALLLLTAIAQGFQAFLKANTEPVISLIHGSSKHFQLSASPENAQTAVIRAGICLCAFQSSDNIDQWSAIFFSIKDEELSQRMLGVAQALYSSVVKACVIWEDFLEPRVLFQLRKSAILLLHTLQIKFNCHKTGDTLMGQARKALLLYARSCSGQISEVVADARLLFTQLIQAQQAEDHVCLSKTSGWQELCEVFIGLARKVGDFELVDQAIALIGIAPQTPTEDVNRLQTQKPPISEQNVGILLANVATTNDFLDHYLKTGQDRGAVNHLEKSAFSIAALTHRGDTMSIELRLKINLVVDKLRRICNRVMRRTIAEESKSSLNERIPVACYSISKTIVDMWANYVLKEGKIADNRAADATLRLTMIAGSVETLVAMAESSFRVDCPESHRIALDHFDRCQPLIKLLNVPDVSIIRCLTSAYYNAGVALYHEGKVAIAIDFVRPACELPNTMFNILGNSGSMLELDSYIDTDGTLQALKQQMIKRWELLALCYLSINPAKSYDAYIAAILSHDPANFACLSKLAGKGASICSILGAAPGLCKLVQRATRLATWELLLPDTQCSLRNSLSSKSLPDSDVGIILELQLQYLYQNTRKGECRFAIKRIINDCLDIYNKEIYPLRRTRALIRFMEWHVSISSEVRSDSTYDTLLSLLAEATALLQASNYGFDDGLKLFANQYFALSYIWLALAAQLRDLQDDFVEFSQQALTKMEGISFRVKSSPLKAKLKTRSIGPTVSKPCPRSVSAKSKVNLVTPLTPVSKINKCPHLPFKTPGQNRDSKPSRLFSPSVKMQSLDLSTVAESCPFDEPTRQAQLLTLFAYVLDAHGLVLLKLRVFTFLQRLGLACGWQSSADEQDVGRQIATNVDLASTYMQCEEYDHSSTLLSDAQHIINSSSTQSLQDALTSESMILLLYSRCFAEAGDLASAISVFICAGDKWTLAIQEDGQSGKSEMSSTQKVVQKTRALQMIALASFTHSHIQEKQGNLTLAIESAARAVRLLYRASSNILRISSRPPEQAAQTVAHSVGDVFSSNPQAQDCVPLPEVPRESTPLPLTIESHPIGELNWKLAGMIFGMLSRVIALYISLGSPRIAEGYLAQLLAISNHIGSPRLKVSSMTIKANILIFKREFEAAETILKDSFLLLPDQPSCEVAELWRLKCEVAYKLANFAEAKAHCAKMLQFLKGLDSNCAFVLQSTSSPKSLKVSFKSPTRVSVPSLTCVVPTLLAAQVTRIQVLISRAMRRSEELSHALRVFSKMPLRAREKVFETTLMAMLRLDDVLQNFRVDPLLGVLPEAMIIIPHLSGLDKITGRKNEFAQLSQPIKLMHEMLTKRVIGCADVVNLHEAIDTLVTLKFVTSILGQTTKNASSEVAALLDFGCNLTLRREMLENLRLKLRSVTPGNDMDWPSEMKDIPETLMVHGTDTDSASEGKQRYWQGLAVNHQNDMDSPATYRPLPSLPTGWRVVSIHLAFDRSSLFVVQHNETCNPFVVKLPMDRFNRREGEDDLFTLPVASKELQEIVSRSNAATQRARHVSGHNEKVLWWQERQQLDARMRNLVENIENNWFGACKGILRSCNKVSDLPAVGKALEKIFRHHLISSQDKHLCRQSLDENIIHCFIALSINCRDEDLEDLIQFAVDSYQTREAPVVGDEVDADQAICELRALQKEILIPYSLEETRQQHLFLILDKQLHGFPWEVLPTLLGHSVSRIPSLSFLRDRLVHNDESIPTPLLLDVTRTSYILNPSGDLSSTQSQFETWLEANQAWNGIKGRPPSSEEVKQALLSKNLMLYFGHGGAEQYIRSSTIKQLRRCAVTMLWGCSSGMLQDQGDFDPTGTPYAYMVAGCPSLLANLWDVTDKDIDRLAIELFKQTGLYSQEHGGCGVMTLTSALAQVRSCCQLKYLNGAAPVVYGIPVKFVFPTFSPDNNKPQSDVKLES